LLPDRGRILFAGADVTRLPASARVRAGIARTFQVTNVFPRLTVEQNVAVPVLARAGQSLKPWRRLEAAEGILAEVRRLLDAFGMADRIVVLHQGKAIADGVPQRIREDPRVREIYLGDASVAPLPAREETGGGAPLLRVERLDAGYGLAHVLHGVSFTVARGEIV